MRKRIGENKRGGRNEVKEGRKRKVCEGTTQCINLLIQAQKNIPTIYQQVHSTYSANASVAAFK